MKNIKKIILFIFVFVLFLFIKDYKEVKATMINETDTITYNGASVRLSTAGKEGLRFSATIDLDEFTTNEGISVSDIDYYGFVVCFGECEKDDLYVGATVNGKNTLTGQSATLFNEINEEFTVVLLGFNSNQYIQKYTARAYVIYNDSTYVYSNDIITRSIYEVASKYEESNTHEYTKGICDIVDEVFSDVISCSDAINTYEASGDTTVTTHGVVTSVSTGTYNNALIEDETSGLTIFSYGASFVGDIEVGNEVIISGTVTKYRGLYELKTITDVTVISSCNKVSDLYIDAGMVFEANDSSAQNHLASGVLEYVSTNDKKITFINENKTFVLFYVDAKWSSYTIEDLVPGEFYYVKGIINYFDGLQIVPVSSDPISSITSIVCTNLLDTYEIDEFDYTDLNLQVTFDNGLVLNKNVNSEMFDPSDLATISTNGEKDITITYYGIDIELEFALVEKSALLISANLDKTTYYVGDNLDLSNATIDVTYVDNSVRTVDLISSYVTGFDNTESGNQELTVTYGGVTDTIDVEVYKPVVIYEVYGAGGNSGATYKNDFVVLYNNTNENINLSSYYFYYASASGSFNSSNTKALSGTIYAHSYYTIVCAGGSDGVEVPCQNVSLSTISMAQGSGRVAIAKRNDITETNDSDLLDNVLYSGASTTKSYKRTSLLNDTFSADTVSLTYLTDALSIVDIGISGLSTKYAIDATLDLTNVIARAYYQNGTSSVLEIEERDFVGFDSSTEGSREMTFTYENFTVKILYSVSDNNGLLDVDIYFIDLGDNIDDCGESTFIKVGDIDILIDGGENSTISANAVKTLVNTYCTDSKLEYLITSHAHSDHIGGMRYILSNYSIDNVIEFDYKYGNTTSSSTVIGYYLKAREKAKNIDTAYNLIHTYGNGQTYELVLAEDISFTFYETGYLNTTGSDKNAQSVVCVFEAYGNRILFTGDAEKECEANYKNLVGNVDILKVAHHGTYNATTADLLNAIDPEVAIICNGNYLGNEYGHPTYDAINRLYQYDSNMLVYTITGANISKMESISSNGPGSTVGVLYAYKTSKRCNFYFKCSSPSDALADRNGNIHINFGDHTYSIDSEYFGNTPLEIKYTSYWQDMVNYLS